MTGPEHYTEAERLLAQADGQYLDTSSEAGTREEYASDADWVRAMEEGAEAHDLSLRTAALFAQMATAHALLASAAATAMQAAVDGSEPGMGSEEFHAWYVAAGVKPIRPGAPDAAEDPDDGFSASELYEMDQADEAALDAAAGGESR
jgi:hypothetical protein